MTGRMKMFADDTKLYGTSSTNDDVRVIQADIDAAVEWADRWQLPFNEEKCKVMHLGRRNAGSQYTMRNTELSVVQVEKDLGVHIDCELKFRQQASTAVGKATQILAVIRRSFASINERTLPLLYKTLVWCARTWNMAT